MKYRSEISAGSKAEHRLKIWPWVFAGWFVVAVLLAVAEAVFGW